MILLRAALRRETAMPMLALIFASAVCLGLVGLRILWTDNIRYAFLLWNLFLAWLPLVFALIASEHFRQKPFWNWRLAALGIAWLLFFPNAPYIFTDLTHVRMHFGAHFWVDLIVTLSCALTGLVLGFLSLYLMQGIVRRLAGAAAGWLFVAVATGLSGFGVWLGRFMRFNSWDIIYRPVDLYHGIGSSLNSALGLHPSLVFPVLFGTFLFIAYLMLYALTHLRHAQHPAALPKIEQSRANEQLPTSPAELPLGSARG